MEQSWRKSWTTSRPTGWYWDGCLAAYAMCRRKTPEWVIEKFGLAKVTGAPLALINVVKQSGEPACASCGSPRKTEEGKTLCQKCEDAARVLAQYGIVAADVPRYCPICKCEEELVVDVDADLESRQGVSALIVILFHYYFKACRAVVRGLICADCKQGLSLFGRDPECLKRASEYLIKAKLGSPLAARTSHSLG
jgi:hypothetical protein